MNPIEERSERISPVCATALAAIALAALAGWLTGSVLLKSWLYWGKPMNPATAVSLLLAATGLWLLRSKATSRRQYACGMACALATSVIGVTRISDYVLGPYFRLDEILFRSALFENRMAPNTAFNFLLIGLALALVDVRPRFFAGLAQVPAALLGLSAIFSLIGYGYNSPMLYGVGPYIPMAFNTAVAFLLMAVGALCLRPGHGLVAIIIADGAGGAVARRLLPIAIGIPCLLGWLRVQGQRADWYDSEFGAVLMVIFSIVIFLGAVLFTAAALNRADHARQVVESQLRAAHDGLELRVRQRTLELATANDSLQREIREHERSETALADANRDLAQKNQENEMFVYSVSHDLRSPLVNLQGFSRELSNLAGDIRTLLTDERLPEDIRQNAVNLVDGEMNHSIRFIQSAVTRLSSIIDALLRLSRAGRVEYQSQPVELGLVLARIVESVSGTINQKDAEIDVDDLPATFGDPTAIEQVFANLVQNALNYLDPARLGKIEVGVSARPQDAQYGCTTYYVKDNGLGIPKQYSAKVFQVFKRFHGEVAKGEGIGLAIVRRIVERHGGRVWFESQVGEGTTFFVAMPKGGMQLEHSEHVHNHARREECLLSHS